MDNQLPRTNGLSLAGRRIVVIDDDQDLLDILGFLLSTEGASVVTYAHIDGVAGEIRRLLPALVLLDLQVPGNRRAGLMVLEQLRADGPTSAIPVILMTGDHDALRRHAVRIQELGATPLPKPFEPDRLCQMIEQLAA